jgi:PAS domain S-box-containing protein
MTKHSEKQQEYIARLEAENARLNQQLDKKRDCPDEHILNQELLNITDNAVLVVDKNRKIKHWNKRAEQLTGLKAKECIGKELNDLNTSFCFQLSSLFDEVHHETGLIEKRRCKINPHKNNEIIIILNAKALQNEQGKFIGGLISFDDITQIEKGRQELEETRLRFEKLATAASEGIILTDKHGRINYSNPAARKMFQLQEEEILGTDFREHVLHDESYDEFLKGIQDFAKSGKGASLDKVHIFNGLRSDNSEFPLETSFSAFYVKQELHTVAIMRDITKRKKIESDLVTARRKAEEADRLKSQFLANMSHEIRTPMNGILGMAEILQQTTLDNNQKEYLNIINKSSNNLLSIINDILDFSKIESNKIELEAIPFNLREVMDEVAELLAYRADEKGVSLNSFTDTLTPEIIVGDPVRLRQVLLNLVNNAVKFTEQGEVNVSSEMVLKDANTIRMRFTVKDTGIGISQQGIQKLFQPFTQVDPATTRKYGGTGLGLIISKKLVEMMGGKLTVESKPGQGATFTFTSSFKTYTHHNGFSQKKKADFSGLHVLIVDDNTNNRIIFRKYLKNWNCYISEARDGHDALQKLQQAKESLNPVKIALLDFQMPEMDGIELAHRIKESPELEDTRLILLTSVTNILNNHEVKEKGFVDYLTKPIKLNHLYNIINRAKSKKPTYQIQEPKTENTETARMKNKKRILLAEDNPVNQKVASLNIKKLGYEVDIVENGKAALEAMQNNEYHAVFMDIQMPVMDGLDATRAMRQYEADNGIEKKISIIAVTANAMKGDRERCLKAGMNAYIAKPFTIDQLNEVLHNI